MSIFSRRSPFDEDRIDWLFQSFEWLLANYGGYDSFLKSYHLVVNNKKEFAVPPQSQSDFVERIFRIVMANMGMGDWDVNLIPMSEADEDIEFEIDSSDLSMGYSSEGAAGFFSIDDCGRAVIGYGDHLRSEFDALVATLSHEAAHYLITKSITEMPGGWRNLEPVTDLTAIFTGFGIFQCNEASVVIHSGGGVSGKMAGYLPESGRAYALAIFSELSMLNEKFVSKQLRLNPRSLFKRAIRDIRENRREKIQHLETVVPLRKW